MTDQAPAKKQCTATSKRTGNRCTKPAAEGWDVCRWHGKGGGAPVLHGLRAVKLYENQVDLTKRIHELENDPELLSVKRHLALLSTMVEEFVDEHNAIEWGKSKEFLTTKSVDELADMVIERDRNSSKRETLKDMADIITKQVTMVEKHHKIQVGHYIPAEKVALWRQLIAERMKYFCKDCHTLRRVARALEDAPIPQ